MQGKDLGEMLFSALKGAAGNGGKLETTKPEQSVQCPGSFISSASILLLEPSLTFNNNNITIPPKSPPYW